MGRASKVGINASVEIAFGKEPWCSIPGRAREVGVVDIIPCGNIWIRVVGYWASPKKEYVMKK